MSEGEVSLKDLSRLRIPLAHIDFSGMDRVAAKVVKGEYRGQAQVEVLTASLGAGNDKKNIYTYSVNPSDQSQVKELGHLAATWRDIQRMPDLTDGQKRVKETRMKDLQEQVRVQMRFKEQTDQ